MPQGTNIFATHSVNMLVTLPLSIRVPLRVIRFSTELAPVSKISDKDALVSETRNSGMHLSASKNTKEEQKQRNRIRRRIMHFFGFLKAILQYWWI